MEKANQEDTNTEEDKISVKICRMGEPSEDIDLSKGATVQDLLDAADFELSSNEELWCEGVKADSEDKLANGDLIQVVGNKEGNR